MLLKNRAEGYFHLAKITNGLMSFNILFETGNDIFEFVTVSFAKRDLLLHRFVSLPPPLETVAKSLLLP